MKFGIRGQLIDVITCVKFLVNRFRSYGVLTPPKLPFPIDLLRRPYDSVRTAVRHCDRGIEAKFLWLDALPLANQQESLAGPHLFSNY